MIDISKAFDTFNRTVIQFFQEPGLGFYIPLYQREYSWDQENIDQLMEDITQGVYSILTDDQEIRFLGTIIRVKENNWRVNINPRDVKAIPTRIDNIIDGQQRISTLALLGSLLYQRLVKLGKKLPADAPYNVINDEILPAKLKSLLELFSIDLQRGTPNLKPIIIRGSIDTWTLDGEDQPNYLSDVSAYLASVIRAIHDKNLNFPPLPKGHLVGANLKLMSEWLDDVEKVHTNQTNDSMDFPTAWDIINKPDLEIAIWTYERDELKQIVNDEANTSKHRDNLCRLIQVLAFLHYLLDRCCFNVIDPVSDNWAFDMFQSLNATGTPLTALETFKPMVVNRSNTDYSNGYKDSKPAGYFAEIDRLFIGKQTAAQKEKLTNEYLSALAHTFDGTMLAQRFSSQRRWLNDVYSACQNKDEREECVRRMANVAQYLRSVTQFSETSSSLPLLDTAPQTERELATMCVLYLHQSGHKMAHTILSLFYSKILRNLPNAVAEFIEACKATAAFYTIWRSAYPNSGLDNAYRQILKGVANEDPQKAISPISWDLGSHNVTFLRKRFLEILDAQKQISEKADWIKKATLNLRFDSAKPVCRFSLLIVAQDTMADPLNLGLMKQATKGSTPNYMTPAMWSNQDLRTIEHIAPQKRPDNSKWENDLYEDDHYQRVGNLILLPLEINSSAGNRDWQAKYIYYMHLAEKDPSKIDELQSLAQSHGVELKQETLELLLNATHNHQVTSVVSLGTGGIWNAQFVEKRTERVCDILWERIYPWLQG